MVRLIHSFCGSSVAQGRVPTKTSSALAGELLVTWAMGESSSSLKIHPPGTEGSLVARTGSWFITMISRACGPCTEPDSEFVAVLNRRSCSPSFAIAAISDGAALDWSFPIADGSFVPVTQQGEIELYVRSGMETTPKPTLSSNSFLHVHRILSRARIIQTLKTQSISGA